MIAIDQIERTSWAAVLLLALPVAELPLVSAHRTVSGWAWRGDREPFGLDPLDSLASLVARNARDGDHFVDLTGDPWQWVRPIRSGVGQVVFGFDTLLGGPALVVDADIPAEAVFELARRYHDGESREVPEVLVYGDIELLIGGDRFGWRVTRTHTPPAGQAALPLDVRLRDVCRLLEAEGLDDVAVLEGPPDQFVVCGSSRTASGSPLRVDVPVHFSPRAASIGVDPTVVVPEPAAFDVPAGWSYAGTHAGDVVAVSPDGVWSYLRRALKGGGAHDGSGASWV